MVYFVSDDVVIILVQLLRWDIRLPFPLSRSNSPLIRVDLLSDGFEKRSIVFDAFVELFFVLEVVCNMKTRQNQ